MADIVAQTQAVVDDSIAKIRQAQKKFEEATARLEAMQKKAEKAAEKLKAVQQKSKDLKASFKPKIGKVAGMAGMVAILVGIMKAQLILKIQEEALKILDKFLQQCPNPKDLQRIIKTKDNLLKNINSFQKRVDKLGKIAQTLLIAATTIKLLIKVITSIPVPTAIIPPQTGGVGIRINILTRYSDALVKINKILDNLIAEAATITTLILGISALIATLKSKLQELDPKIQRCTISPLADPNSDTPPEGVVFSTDELAALSVAALVNTAQPKENTGSEGTPNLDYTYKSKTTGKNYILSIVQDIDSSKIAPKRYAVAKDLEGIIRLKGESSFSSSTQVLLDELKFKIDSQLL